MLELDPKTSTVLLNLLGLFFLNYVADYLLQTREMGQKKSSNLVFLSAHIFVIFVVILLGSTPMFGFAQALKFSFWNAATHFFVDLVYWNLYGLIVLTRENEFGSDIGHLFKNFKHYKNKLIEQGYKYWEDKKFFDTIGIDCHTHLYLLVLVYFLVINPIGG